MSPRHSFSTVFNFRDLGGHRTVDGRSVRYGRLYRSDSLHRLTPQEGRLLAGLGVRTVLDLRRPKEVAALGRVPADLGVAYHNIAPEHREWDPDVYDETAGPHRFLADRYLDMAEEGYAGIGRALCLIADADRAPLVMHCFAGKDRTGVLAALTLSLLGVADEDVAREYALSEAAQQGLSGQLRTEMPDAAGEIPPHFLACPPPAMLLFLTDLRARHGSIPAYLARAGVTPTHITALRTHLLTPP